MPYQFDYRRYTNRLNTETGQIEPTETLSPRSDAYANNGFIISFYHMITGKELKFKAFITSFNETYTPDYASEQVFGRADPIHTYRGTTRSIALGFVIPAESISEAYENLAKTQTLAQMQYPAYTDVQNALTIAQAPLVRLKVMNLLRAANKGPNQQLTGGPIDLYDSYKSEDNPEFGLLGIIDSLTVDHQLAADIGVLEKDVNTILPKQIDIQIGFKPLHEHTNGWIKNDNDKFDFAEPSFPYGAAEYNNTGVAAVEYSNLSEEPTRAEQESAEAETPFEGADGSGGSSISGTDRLVDGQY
jgi:hypothetical protein